MQQFIALFLFLKVLANQSWHIRQEQRITIKILMWINYNIHSLTFLAIPVMHIISSREGMLQEKPKKSLWNGYCSGSEYRQEAEELLWGRKFNRNDRNLYEWIRRGNRQHHSVSLKQNTLWNCISFDMIITSFTKLVSTPLLILSYALLSFGVKLKIIIIKLV